MSCGGARSRRGVGAKVTNCGTVVSPPHHWRHPSIRALQFRRNRTKTALASRQVSLFNIFSFLKVTTQLEAKQREQKTKLQRKSDKTRQNQTESEGQQVGRKTVDTRLTSYRKMAATSNSDLISRVMTSFHAFRFRSEGRNE